MFDRNFARRVAMLFFAGGLFTSVALAQTNVAANDPVTLGFGTSPIFAPILAPDQLSAPSKEKSIPDSNLPETTSVDSKSIGVPSGAAQSDDPPIEHKSLGKPSPILNRSPAASETSSRSTLERLDPRTNEVTRVISALAVVLGLLVLVRIMLRRAGGFLTPSSRPSGVLEILARYPIGRGQSLLLIKLARRIVLLHQSGSTMTRLSEITNEHEVAALLSRMESGSSLRNAAKFRRTLNEFMTTQDDSHEPTSRSQRTDLPPSDAEIVDLTRSRTGLWQRMFSRQGVNS